MHLIIYVSGRTIYLTILGFIRAVLVTDLVGVKESLGQTGGLKAEAKQTDLDWGHQI